MYIVSKFQFDLACFLGGEANTKFGQKVKLEETIEQQSV